MYHIIVCPALKHSMYITYELKRLNQVPQVEKNKSPYVYWFIHILKGKNNIYFYLYRLIIKST